MDVETDARPASRGHVFTLMRTAVEGMADSMRDALGLHGKRVAALEQRIAELEARPALKYLGTHAHGKRYSPGECCTHRGSLWHANRTTTATPGESDDWTLCVKRGSDGKDARDARGHR